jgi:hypothetical protein
MSKLLLYYGTHMTPTYWTIEDHQKKKNIIILVQIY